MTVNLSLFAGVGAQLFGDDGSTLAGGKIYSYVAGTTTPQTTYTTVAGNVAHTNPIILNSAGRVPNGGEVWTDDSVVYKFVLKNSSDATVATYDNVTGGGNAFIQVGSGAVTTTVQNKLRETISVKDFGAVGDGTADDTTAIQNAAAAATSVGKRLYVPKGTYKLTAAVTFTTGVIGDGPSQTLFQGTNLGTSSGYLINITGGDLYQGFLVDGACSADPASWNNSNYNSFTGWRSIYLYQVTGVHLVDVIGQNSVDAPIRVELCQNVNISNCQAIRGRGQSGDGFYIRRSVRVSLTNCRANDVTRIGFVTEGVSGGAILISDQISFTNCYADYAHDQSINYGGTEYNAGFWSENSNAITYTDCTTLNTGNRGFTFAGTTLVATAGYDVCQAKYTNCHVDTAYTGFNVYSLTSSCPALVTLSGCSSEGTTEDFYVTEGKFTIINCSAEKDGGGSQSKCIYTGTNADVYISNFFEKWTNQPADVASASTDAGSISKFSTNNPKRITVDNYTTYDGSAFSLKLRSASSTTDVSVQNSRLLSVVARVGSISLRNCNVDYMNVYPATSANFLGCYFSGKLHIEESTAVVTKRIECCQFNRSNEMDASLSFFSANNTQTPLIFVSGCNFNGNLETGANFIIVNSSSGTASSTRSHDIYMNNSVLYNTGGAAATAAITLIRADGSSRAYIASTWKSSTIGTIATRTAAGSTFNDI